MTKLKTLLNLYSIPLEQNWEQWNDPKTYTVYKYWQSLGIINQIEHDSFLANKKVYSTPIMERFFKNIDYHFKPKYYKDGFVVDVGSGFGFITFWLLLSGAKKVYTIGDPLRIEFIKRLYNEALKRNIVIENQLIFSSEFIKEGDVSLAKDIKNETIDMVLLNDTLEHITKRIFPSLVKASFNNLKKGGLFISRQQNTDSPAVIKALKPFWEKREEIEYINQRVELIRKEIASINETDLLILAKQTRGLDIVDFKNAVENYSNKGIFPNHDTIIPPIDLDKNVPCEGYTEIDRITSEFKKNRFQEVFVYPDMMTSSRSRVLQPLSKSFPAFFLNNHLFDTTTVFCMKK